MTRFLITAAMAPGGFAAAAQADDLYYINGHHDSCPLGMGGEGIIATGSGRFSTTETHHERVSDRQALGDGWQRTTWACMPEGEECGREAIDLRITAARVDVRFADGQTLTGRNCPA